jgi:hypothetical protein
LVLNIYFPGPGNYFPKSGYPVILHDMGFIVKRYRRTDMPGHTIKYIAGFEQAAVRHFQHEVFLTLGAGNGLWGV